MLKILMLASNVYPVPAVRGGSIETLIQYFLEENIKRQRIDLTVYSPDDPLARKAHSELYPEANIVFIKKSRLDALWNKLWPINRGFLRVYKRLFVENPYIKRIYKDIKNKNYDYIIFEGNYYEKCSYLYKKIGREKLIIHWHMEIQGRRIFSDWFSNHLCISNYVARVLICNGFVKHDNAHIVRNCTDISLFSQVLPDEQRTELLRKYGISENDFVISFVGRTIPEKGVRELLLAFNEVCKKNDNCKLLIIGSSAFGFDDTTAYQAELRKISESLQDKVVFTGFIHHNEMWKSLKLSDLAVFPSIWNEGAGLVALEVMAASVPLITFNVGGIPEYVDKEASIVLNWDKNIVRKLADNIMALKDNKELLLEMSKRGYEHVQKHSIENYYDNFCDVLYDIKEGERKQEE